LRCTHQKLLNWCSILGAVLRISTQHWLAVICVLLLLAGGFLVNRLQHGLLFWEWVLWSAAYLLALLFSLFAAWRPAELGLDFTPWLAVVSAALLLLLSVYLGTDLPPVYDWRPWVTEAFARTSEEILFRGVLFGLVLRGLGIWRWRGLAALLLTSLLFALVHAPFYGSAGQTNLPLAFLLGIVLGLLRLSTGSVLPGIMLHGILNAGIPGMVLGTGLYFAAAAAVFLIEQRRVILLAQTHDPLPGKPTSDRE
jgi:membrane protease YdiL (CAAX protease family)